jgi:transcriptional regulator
MLSLAYTMVRAAYLTPKQVSFWNLRRQGLTQAEVSQKIGVTPQTINKTFNAIDKNMSRALTDAPGLIFSRY